MLNVQKRRNTVVCSTASAERRSLEHWADTSVKRTCGCVVLLPLVAIVITLTLKVDKSFNYAQKSAETQVGKKTISLLIHPSKGHQICKTENKNTILSIDHSLYRVCVCGGVSSCSSHTITFISGNKPKCKPSTAGFCCSSSPAKHI